MLLLFKYASRVSSDLSGSALNKRNTIYSFQRQGNLNIDSFLNVYMYFVNISFNKHRIFRQVGKVHLLFFLVFPVIDKLYIDTPIALLQSTLINAYQRILDSRDRPKSFKHLVTAPLPYARHYV